MFNNIFWGVKKIESFFIKERKLVFLTNSFYAMSVIKIVHLSFLTKCILQIFFLFFTKVFLTLDDKSYPRPGNSVAVNQRSHFLLMTHLVLET